MHAPLPPPPPSRRYSSVGPVVDRCAAFEPAAARAAPLTPPCAAHAAARHAQRLQHAQAAGGAGRRPRALALPAAGAVPQAAVAPAGTRAGGGASWPAAAAARPAHRHGARGLPHQHRRGAARATRPTQRSQYGALGVLTPPPTALSHPAALLSRAFNEFSAELCAFRNREDEGRIIVLADWDERLATVRYGAGAASHHFTILTRAPQPAATLLWERGVENVFVLTGGALVTRSGACARFFAVSLASDARVRGWRRAARVWRALPRVCGGARRGERRIRRAARCTHEPRQPARAAPLWGHAAARIHGQPGRAAQQHVEMRRRTPRIIATRHRACECSGIAQRARAQSATGPALACPVSGALHRKQLLRPSADRAPCACSVAPAAR